MKGNFCSFHWRYTSVLPLLNLTWLSMATTEMPWALSACAHEPS